ncbi:zona pellucida glycoprotein d [Eucyclogobius newberryi]|uniref:zona pellucida glycoprotein d n=1 Tax=Eucyclogobius newberryi TaxID=166745 RepID=UPI003B5A5AFC
MIYTGLKLGAVLVALIGLELRHCVQGLCSQRHCTNNDTCTVSQDQRSCKCVQGYYGDLCDRSAHIQVNCERDSIAIRAVESYFTYLKVPLDSLHLPNKSCRAQKEVINGVTYYTAKVSKDKYLLCGGRPLEKNITHIAYSLTLMSNPRITGNIIREPAVKLDFKCVFPYIRTVSLKYPILPFFSETVVRVDELDATIQMMLYTDHSYSTAYSRAPTIELGDKVYVEVMVTEPAEFFLLRLNECWATQSPQPNSTDGHVHALLLNGCVEDDTVTFRNKSNTDFGNGQGSAVRYSFEMFRFTDHPYDLYLHCAVQICEPEDYRTCRPNCNSISKREAVMVDRTHGLLSYGPIKLGVSEKSRSNIVTSVVLPVAGVWIVGFFLVLLITVAKAGHRRATQALTL